MPDKPLLHHIPICPFSQRVEIMLAMKGLPRAVDFNVVDITRPRDPVLLAKMKGTTALPALELPDGRILKESLVILEYLDLTIGETSIRQADPWRRAVESSLLRHEPAFVAAGYGMILNQDLSKRDDFLQRLLRAYQGLNQDLLDINPNGDFLFETFGFAATVYTPLFQRFWFLDYYEGFALPDQGYERVKRWKDACLASDLPQQVCFEEVVKLYYDYAQGEGLGRLLPERKLSSLVFEPDWRTRPMPPNRKYGPPFASDEELGLV